MAATSTTTALSSTPNVWTVLCRLASSRLSQTHCLQTGGIRAPFKPASVICFCSCVGGSLKPLLLWKEIHS
eukprot:m.453381 g.453381  ORF g.453381 m.453381 type:complete len:71 (+) comp20486_c0_seq1:575-787(+)